MFPIFYPGVFCENFIDADVKEYSFAKENQIFPLQEDMVPVNRRSKKFSTAMQSALAEQEIIDSVIEVHRWLSSIYRNFEITKPCITDDFQITSELYLRSPERSRLDQHPCSRIYASHRRWIGRNLPIRNQLLLQCQATGLEKCGRFCCDTNGFYQQQQRWWKFQILSRNCLLCRDRDAVLPQHRSSSCTISHSCYIITASLTFPLMLGAVR